jgi:hypothetical protein
MKQLAVAGVKPEELRGLVELTQHNLVGMTEEELTSLVGDFVSALASNSTR